MGSTARGQISGFVCRLCSKMNRFVIFIFSEEGNRLKLHEKINSYLPVMVHPKDRLPKTACLQCIHKLQLHHTMLKRIKKGMVKLGTGGTVQMVHTDDSDEE